MKNMQKPNLTDTGISHNAHKRTSRQALVYNTTDTSVCQTPFTTTRICKCCGRRLPNSNFYMRDRLKTPDSYCKECRKTANRLRRKNKTHLSALSEDAPDHLVITSVEQREERLKLIMHALQTVHESMDRQREKIHRQELQKEWDIPVPFAENN